MPFDQIYWNSGAAFRDTGESETSGTKDCRIGETADSDPNSTFSFLGNRRTQIVNMAQKVGSLGGIPATNRRHRHAFHLLGTGAGEIGDPNNATNYSGGAVNSMVNADIPATAPVGTTLFDCQNRESAHHSANYIFLNNITNFFNGIHSSDPISITTTGKPYKGCYLILKRKKFFYNEFQIGTDQGTMQTAVDDVDGGTINVTDAVIDPRMSPRLAIFTGSVDIKSINIYINGEPVSITGDTVVANTDMTWTDNTSTIQTPTCDISGTTITLNNTFQNNGEHRRYFNTNFQIRIGGTDYNITNVASASITVDSAPGDATGSDFSIVMPNGAPAVGDVTHVANSGLTAGTQNTAAWNEFSWGMYSNKHLAGTSTVLFEDTDTYGVKTRPDDIATRSPYFSNMDGENFAVINNSFFNFSTISIDGSPGGNAYTVSAGADRYLTIPSVGSKAIFPNFGNNLNGTIDGVTAWPTIVNQTFNATIAGYVTDAFGFANQYSYWDGMVLASRAHGVSSIDPAISTITNDPNLNIDTLNAGERNSAKYPYSRGRYGYHDIDLDGVGFNTLDPSTLAQDDAHCFTILDTNRIITPGSTIEVTIELAEGVDNSIRKPCSGTDYFAPKTEGNDGLQYERRQREINEFELIIVAK